ncbi:MAG: GGDEF domain-containing protein [Lachnospiraceae bacterium]|nr:GGDEF domain-containing protein [Lachnospiraceae bacterium]
MKKENRRLNIGFFTCHLDNDYAYEVCKGVDYAAKELDVNLIVFPGMYMNASYNDPKNARFDYQYNSIFYYASEHTLDALIVSIGSIGSFLSESDMIAFLKNFDIPILTIEIEVPGYPYLYTEGKTGMRQAVEHLIKDHGKTKIGMVSGRKENADAKDRLDTYKQVLTENNIPVDENKIVYGDFSEFTEGIVTDLLDRNPDLEAIVFANDQMAIGGYTAIKSKGLEIGKDILVTGYDDSPASVVLDPMLTTVHNQIMDMGYHSVYEVINLVNNGKTNVSLLDSGLVVRSSCGCANHRARKMISDGVVLSKSDNSDNLIKTINNYLFDNYSTNFYYNDLKNRFNPLLKLILDPIVVTGDLNFDKEAIINTIHNLLHSPLISNYFSSDKLTNFIRDLNNLLVAISPNTETSSAIATLFNTILSTLIFYTSSTLYNKTRQHKMGIWSSMYITRDTLTYSDDEESCFNLILEKLESSNFVSSYIYIYEDPIMLMPNGSWKVPKTLYLQACSDHGKKTYLTGDNRLISCNNVFFNDYTTTKDRRTLVINPLFTNSIQYGLFVGEIDIDHFSNIYPTNLQLAMSLNFISLMKQQLYTQKKLSISASELNEKNKLLNKLSITDELTGINNRRGFMESVRSQVNAKYNEGMRAMFVFADMDNLKQVNDIYGHQNGDFAINSISDILKQTFADDDIIGRIGGDEFVAFSFIDDDDQKPNQIRNTITELSRRFNDTCGKPYYIDISLGISTFTCSPTLNIEEVLHNADEALYENKKYKRESVVKPKA